MGQGKTLAPPEFVAWLPITDAERALKSPSVEKDSGAEILIWRVHVVDELLGNNEDLQRVFYHYVRLKVFTEKGKQDASTIDLPYRQPGAVLNVSGRTVKPDGTILELDGKTVYRRDRVRVGRAVEKVVSFAMPGVEPGAILEYRWKQTEDDNRFRYLRLNFQRDFPVQNVTYFLKPLSKDITGGEQMFLMPLNCRPSPLKIDNDGYNYTTLTNVPASHDEPYAPSDPNIQPWALLFYSDGGKRDPEKYWGGEGRKISSGFKSALKSSEEVKAAATEAAAGAKDDNEKLNALVAAVRKRLRGLFDDSVTTAEREQYFAKFPKDRDRTSAEIFKSGIATSDEMNVVFAAMAQQLGLETRAVLVGSRDELIFNPQLTDRYFLRNRAVAVKLGADWKIADVSSRHLPPGMLPWEEEGMFALLADPKAPSFVNTPVSAPDASVEHRIAHLKLSALGTLDGEVQESYTGHSAEALRETIEQKSQAQQEEWLRDRMLRRFPDSKISAVRIQNADDSSKPLLLNYQIEAPQFAQVTGKRLLFQPNAFRRGQASPFTASERHFSIDFPYGWKEVDELTIGLPDGFSLDNADNPGNLDFGDIGSYKLSLATRGSNELVANREFVFGNKGILHIDAKGYAAVKGAFDQIQVRDSHSISLKGN